MMAARLRGVAREDAAVTGASRADSSHLWAATMPW